MCSRSLRNTKVVGLQDGDDDDDDDADTAAAAAAAAAGVVGGLASVRLCNVISEESIRNVTDQMTTRLSTAAYNLLYLLDSCPAICAHNIMAYTHLLSSSVYCVHSYVLIIIIIIIIIITIIITHF